MFDFLDEDWFVIGLEILFLLFIAYDVRKYIQTRKREYIVNILMAIGFGAWVLYPFYIKYFMWEEKERTALIQSCLSEHNASYCSCVGENIVKEYTLEQFKGIDQKNDKEFLAFIEESKKECFESSWF